jgi:hypothetical protein
MKRLLLSAVLSMSCFGVALAGENQAYQCQRNDDMRSVSVEYSSMNGGQSCSVMYKKSTNSSDPAKELWHYQAHADQCDVQAKQFLTKLEGFGLSCSPTQATAMKQ